MSGLGLIGGDGLSIFPDATTQGGYNGGNSGSSQTITLDNGTIQDFTLTANTVFTLPNAPSSDTAQVLYLRLTQDSTGSRVPLFKLASGDSLSWLYNMAPNINSMNIQAGQTSVFMFVLANNMITGIFLNPRDIAMFTTGGNATAMNLLSFLGAATVSKRLPLRFTATELQTTDATTTNLLTIPMPVGRFTSMFAFIQSFKSDGSSGGWWFAHNAWRRVSGGNVTEISAGGIVDGGEDDTGSPIPSFDADTSGQLCRLRFTGVAATTFNTVAYALIMEQDI